MKASDLYASPNALAAQYGRFRVAERLLLTGHSHQAWPDVAAVGQMRALEDAAEHIDDKWTRAFEQADRVRAGFARLLDTSKETLSLGANTHELLVRWLSALPLRERPTIVTTDGEFHSVRRQLVRLEEAGLRVARVPSAPADTVGERLATAVDDHVAGVIASTVFFETAELAGSLGEVMRACDRHGAALLLDAYHHLNVVPFSLLEQGLENAFVTGGGYKYCQLGEGNCFLRAPENCTLRPIVTGWFAEYDDLSQPGTNATSYGPLTIRFAGATYDPTSHYRAAEVFQFFRDMRLDVKLLREVNQHQLGLLRAEFDALALDPEIVRRADVPLARLGGFLALRSPRAAELKSALARRQVFADARGDVLRLGPAPYLSDVQLRSSIAVLGDIIKEMEA